jgi:hypothetical protein
MVQERHAQHAFFFVVFSVAAPARWGRKLLSASSLLGKTREQILNWAVVFAHVVLFQIARQVSAWIDRSFAFLKRYLTIVLGRFCLGRLHVMLYGHVNDLNIRMRSLNARNGSLDVRSSGFYCPM